ncbi:MAG: hypothetical protein EOP19_20500 [Hyphomicrobiales bacterium]|nr:MAG: hypothetical protein EOP19_20500 [Hyphomicrobiales bacterium]
MRLVMALALLVGTAGWAGTAQAACSSVDKGWIADSFQISADDLLTLTDIGLGAYVLGYTQGLLISVRAGSDEACVDTLSQCTSGYRMADLVDRLRRYVADKPEARQQLASQVTFDAIFGPCLSNEAES